MPLVNALVLGNLCEYRSRLYIIYCSIVDFLDYIFVAERYGPICNKFDVVNFQMWRIQ